MSPRHVMAQLCWLYGRSDLFIARLIQMPLHRVHSMVRAVRGLRGVAQ